ncbi:MAG: DUF1570 domain-containing protein [Planctomycetota bacterium]
MRQQVLTIGVLGSCVLSCVIATVCTASGAAGNPAPARIAAVSAATAPVTGTKSPADYLAEALAAGEKYRLEKKFDEALYELQKVLFVDPKNSKAKRSSSKIRNELSSALVEQSKASWKTDPKGAMKTLHAAYDNNPTGREVKALFKKRGYRLHEGRWLTKAGIKEFEAEREAAGMRRHKEIGLRKSFKVLHNGPFRFFTNLDIENAQGNLIQEIIQSNLSHYREYTRVMKPLGLRFPTEGIDIVLFDTRHGYMNFTRAEGSAGVYIPSKRAGFFYRIGGGIDFSTMLHEMTHQLCDKVLVGLGLSGWFEEGMAEYFGAGLLTQGGKRLRLGGVEASRLRGMHRALRGQRAGGIIPLAQFTEMPRAQLTGQFYSQAWALVHFLMEEHPYGRLIIYDYVAGGKRYRRTSGTPYATYSLKSVLKEYGITLDELETQYVRFYREGSR